MGKTSYALGVHLREHGHAAAAEDALTSAFDELMAASIPTRTACALIRRSRATHYRHQQHPRFSAPESLAQSRTMVRRSPPPNGLTCLRSSTPTSILTWRFVRSTPVNSTTGTTGARPRRCIASLPKQDKIVSDAGSQRIRRRSNRNCSPTGPSQVWTWDITKLRGPTKGVWFHLYVLIDIYSRYKPVLDRLEARKCPIGTTIHR